MGWYVRDKLGFWVWQMPATVYKIDKQGPPGNRKVYLISSKKLQWKRKSRGARVYAETGHLHGLKVSLLKCLITARGKRVGLWWRILINTAFDE